jgi:hypothetical protein
MEHAKIHGCYGAEYPLVFCDSSVIPSAGFGVFAATDLYPNDYATFMSGRKYTKQPRDPNYMMETPPNPLRLT